MLPALSMFAPLVAFLGCGLLLGGWLRQGRLMPLDQPNERSLHVTPVPRIGGVGMLAGLLLASPFLSLAWPLAGAFLLAALSWLDDMRGLPVRIRLPAHALVAGLFLYFSGVSTGWLLPTTLALVWMINLYNFMDGADGLAGGMALIGFASYALLAGLAGDVGMARLCGSIAAAALAFLWFNFPPAKLFMGDAGSIPLGFLAAALGLIGWQRSLWPALVPLLLFSPFIVDASVTLLKRTLRGERLWQAHREHYYQRLVRMGWSHRRLALSEYVLMAAAATSALWLAKYPQWQGVVVVVWSGFYLVVMVSIDRRWRGFVGTSVEHASVKSED